MRHCGGQILWQGLLALVLLLPFASQGATTVVFPRPETDSDHRNNYAARLLELALQRVPGDYRVRLSEVRMQQGRAIVMLQRGEGVDIVSFMTSAEREAALLPIRVPIDRGLIGWRLLLVNSSSAFRDGVASLDQLKGLRAGQGSDWPDTAILRANGFTVHSTSSYESLFNMLATGRIDYFPRAVTEIWQEAELHPGLVVEPKIVLRYPSAVYFFVRKGNDKLAKAVTAGLDKMIADGSFDKLFMEYYGDVIRRSGLKDRRVYDLANPLLPAGIPAERHHLLYGE